MLVVSEVCAEGYGAGRARERRTSPPKAYGPIRSRFRRGSGGSEDKGVTKLGSRQRTVRQKSDCLLS